MIKNVTTCVYSQHLEDNVICEKVTFIHCTLDNLKYIEVNFIKFINSCIHTYYFTLSKFEFHHRIYILYVWSVRQFYTNQYII